MLMRAAGAAAILLAAMGLCRAEESAPKCLPPHISIQGEAMLEARPDIAILSLGVVNEAATADAATAENAAPTTAVVQELKALGVDPKDIKTANLSVAPIVVEDRDPTTRALIKRAVTGYRASHMLRIQFREVDKAGLIVAKVVASGANQFQGLAFRLSDEAARTDVLRAKAVAEAKRRAELYANGVGMKLGRVLALEPEAERLMRGEADLPMARAPAAPAPAIPIEPGVVALTATVIATWELLPE
ncbi:MAG TPA: SIMPL domain-containing protein [Methylocystis sp.]|nr:SIMPL domain-containing protein [Methylocystis sp.]